MLNSWHTYVLASNQYYFILQQNITTCKLYMHAGKWQIQDWCNMQNICIIYIYNILYTSQCFSHILMTCQIVISAGVWVLVYTCSVLSASFDLNDGDGGDILHLSGPKLELMRPSFVKLSTHWPCYICIDTILITVFWFQKIGKKCSVPKQKLIHLFAMCSS